MAKQEVAAKTKNEVAVSAVESEIFGAMDYQETESKDLLIPKVLLMQGSSKYVKEDPICKVGDLVKSTTGEVYGSVREKDYSPLKFVPVYMFKTWVKQENIPTPSGKDKLQWIATEPVTPENSDQPWEQEILDQDSGQLRKYKLTKNVNFYIILEKDFGNPLAVPHVLTFRGTSLRGGALLIDWFAQCKTAQAAKVQKDPSGQLMVPFAKRFELGGKMEKNDEDQSWFVLTTKEAGQVDNDIIAQGFNWYKVVSKSQHKDVDNSDEKAEGVTKSKDTL